MAITFIMVAILMAGSDSREAKVLMLMAEAAIAFIFLRNIMYKVQ